MSLYDEDDETPESNDVVVNDEDASSDSDENEEDVLEDACND